MSNSQNAILESWSDVKALVEAAETDVVKNANGNSAAGVRARRALRLLKNLPPDQSDPREKPIACPDRQCAPHFRKALWHIGIRHVE